MLLPDKKRIHHKPTDLLIKHQREMFPSLKDCKDIKTQFELSFTIIYDLSKNYKTTIKSEIANL